eukprot:scaffold284635_cov30-Tisochrysis_lutea.AAC.2
MALADHLALGPALSSYPKREPKYSLSSPVGGPPDRVVARRQRGVAVAGNQPNHHARKLFIT